MVRLGPTIGLNPGLTPGSVRVGSPTPAPTISLLAPDSDVEAGGTTVTVTGTNFIAAATTVTIGATTIPAGSVDVDSATSLTFVVPAGSAGSVDVSVTTAGGTSNELPFEYEEAFSPLALPNLEFWLDASDASTFTLVNTDQVTQWRDKSGLSNHFSKTGGNATRSGTQNGLTTVQFVSQATVEGPNFTAVDNFTVIVAGKRTGGSTTACNPVNFGIGGSGYAPMYRANGANVGFIRQGVAFHTSTTPDPAAASVLILRRTSGVWSMRLNGAALSGFSTSGAPSAPTTRTELGTASVNGFVGDLYEVIRCGSGLSDGDCALAEAFIAAKWATP